MLKMLGGPGNAEVRSFFAKTSSAYLQVSPRHGPPIFNESKHIASQLNSTFISNISCSV
jgi:hypothetical protein